MDDTLSLGTATAAWMIKDFSVALRQQITAAARRQGCTVADWLHGHFQKHGIDGQQFAPVKLAAVSPPPALAAPDAAPDAQAVAVLVQAACQLGAARGVARPVREAANRAIAQLIVGHTLALPAPDGAAGA